MFSNLPAALFCFGLGAVKSQMYQTCCEKAFILRTIKQASVMKLGQEKS
jgi:hypothetical protein